VKNNAIKSTAVILSHGDYVDLIDNKEKTPLCYAVEADRKVMAQFLIEAGASPRLRVKGKSIYEMARNDKMRQLLSQACPERIVSASQQKGRSL
jgi:ankyrin repeat protein